MTELRHLTTPSDRRIAYHFTPGAGPVVVFLGGFMSDMTGTKAVHLERWASARNQAFLRLDYSGHGQSSGAFVDGSIGDWADDAFHTIQAICDGPVILVGSSMGGWISLILTRKLGDKVTGFVGIASAPDFTEDSMWASFTDSQRSKITQNGQLALPSDYSDDPYIITQKLIEDGRNNLVLRSDLPLPFPVRLLQGTADTDVPQSVALRLLDHATGPDIRLTLVKGADHRFSDLACLALIETAIAEVLSQIQAGPR